MIIHPAVIVHGLRDARGALAPGLPVTLLSAPAAAGFAGCQWWREMVAAARSSFPHTESTDVLDCAASSGLAMGALRCGVLRIILWPDAPGWDRVAAVAAAKGGAVLARAPPALDLARRNAIRELDAWLRRAGE